MSASSDLRAALFYAPPPEDPLWPAACAWLGRDAATGGAAAQPALPGLAEITADARRYGFHATLKPPMRLRRGLGALLDDARALAAGIEPFALPPLALAELSGVLALRETLPCPAVQALADHCVAALDAHRAAPDAAELARRRGAGLSPARDANLRRWGYPDVFNTWRFHMTLSRRLTGGERAAVRPALEAHLGDAPARPRRVADLCVFVQPGAGAPFTIAERLPLRG